MKVGRSRLRNEKFFQKGRIDEIVEDMLERLVSAVCSDSPSTSYYSSSDELEDHDAEIELLHSEMTAKATALINKVVSRTGIVVNLPMQ